MPKVAEKEFAAFTLRLSPPLKSRLDEQARELGLSLTSYIRMILTERANLNKNKSTK